MKKVLLTSVATLSLLTAVTVFANDNTSSAKMDDVKIEKTVTPNVDKSLENPKAPEGQGFQEGTEPTVNTDTKVNDIVVEKDTKGEGSEKAIEDVLSSSVKAPSSEDVAKEKNTKESKMINSSNGATKGVKTLPKTSAVQ